MTPFQRALNDFVKSITGQARNVAAGGVFDFMHVTALFPRYWLAGSPDPNNPPHYQDPEGTTPGYWIVPQTPTDYEHMGQCYSVVTTVTEYCYGLQTTSVATKFPYFENPLNPTSPNTADPSGIDYRVTGIPGGVGEGITVNSAVGDYLVPDSIDPTLGQVFTGGTFNATTGLMTGGSGTGVYWRISGLDFVTSNELRSNPVLITSGAGWWSETHYYPFTVTTENPSLPQGTKTNPWKPTGPTSKTITYSGPVISFAAQCEALLNMAPLIPKSFIGTREGNLYFDYFGTSSTDTRQPNLIPSNATYNQVDGNGHYTRYNLTGLNTAQLYGITNGVNEDASFGGVFSYEPYFTGSGGIYGGGVSTVVFGPSFPTGTSYCYQWYGVTINGTTATTNNISLLKCPQWSGGVNSNNTGISGPFPDCSTFQCCNPSSTIGPTAGSVWLTGGWYGITPWTAGATHSVGDAVIDSTWLKKMVCTVAGTSSGSEPSWPALNATVSDAGGVTWRVVAIGAPVTAKITPTHTNRLIVFPLKDGPVITALAETGLPIFPALNANPVDLDGSFPEGFESWDCYVCQGARFRIPKNPTSPTYVDYTCYADICPSPFDLFLVMDMGMNFSGGYVEAATAKVAFFETLTTGETIIGPGSVSTPTGQGYIQFGQPQDVNYSPTHVGRGSAGGSSQDSDGL